MVVTLARTTFFGREREKERVAELMGRVPLVTLTGVGGAGKTRLVQAVAKAVGIEPSQVLSPTFVLVHEYRVHGSHHGGQAGFRTQPSVSVIYHIDAYRIRDDDEFRELGPEEYFESDSWTFIEWADRVADCLPREYLEIKIDVTGPTTRRFLVAANGNQLNPSMTALKSELRTDQP